jgi:hypothetical protein
MADKANHNKQFTAEDIERYHSGQMPPQEMHQLEKAALDDPFLADALEGYAYTKTPQADLAAITQRLAEKQDERKVVPMQQGRFSWLKIAAAILVIVTAGWLFYQTTNSANNEVALKQEINKDNRNDIKKIQENAPVTDTTVSVVSSEKDLRATTPQENKANPNLPNEQTSSSNDDIAITDRRADKETNLTYQKRNTIVDSNYFRNNAVMTNPVASGPSQPRANFYNGRVVDHYNRAVTNATIVANNNLSVKTDKQGVFTFPAQDSTIDATVKAKGFQSNQAKLNADEPIVIVLQPLQNVMQEVVVIPKRKQDSTAAYAKRRSILTDTVEPINGWMAFEDYVDSNLVEVADLVKANEGEVELSFDVNRSGEPVNIKVVRSLCLKCDEEAIRLLKEGPKWIRKKNKKGKVTIKF